jgi:hypothetical protein
MPIPLVPLALGALFGSAATRKDKKKAVSGYTTKKGKKVKTIATVLLLVVVALVTFVIISLTSMSPEVALPDWYW